MLLWPSPSIDGIWTRKGRGVGRCSIFTILSGGKGREWTGGIFLSSGFIPVDFFSSLRLLLLGPAS